MDGPTSMLKQQQQQDSNRHWHQHAQQRNLAEVVDSVISLEAQVDQKYQSTSYIYEQQLQRPIRAVSPPCDEVKMQGSTIVDIRPSTSRGFSNDILQPILSKPHYPTRLQMKPTLVRPVPLKVVRPVPQRAAEAFYEATASQNIPQILVQKAVMDSHEWHRRWTQQEETGHTMPEDDGYGSIYSSVFKDQLALQELIARDYAHNPAPDEFSNKHSREDAPEEKAMDMEDFDALLQRKRSLRRRGIRDEQVEKEESFAPAPIPEEEEIDDTDFEVERVVKKRYQEPVPQREPKVSNPFLASPQVANLQISQQPIWIPREQFQQLFKQADTFQFLQEIHQKQEERCPEHCPSDFSLSGSESSKHSNGVPKAMRMKRHDSGDFDDEIGYHSGNMHHADRDDMAVSPLTIASSSSHSSSGSISSLPRKPAQSSGEMGEPGEYQQTLAAQPAVHVIEDDCNDLRLAMRDNSWVVEPKMLPQVVSNAREGLLQELAISGGDTSSENFAACLEILQDHFDNLEMDTCAVDCTATEGMWLTLTKPSFFANCGENEAGDALYTLGRMSFDMFSPTQTVCSLQGNFNSVRRVSAEDRKMLLQIHRDQHDHYCSIPSKLQEEVESGETAMRSYDIVTAFTIEPDLVAYPKAPNKDVKQPIRGIMTTYGYSLPDPELPNRHSLWITGGNIEPNDTPEDRFAWKRLFTAHPPKHSWGEQAKLLAVKMLMGAVLPDGMDPRTGRLEYQFTRPLGGHGMAYVETLYCDSTLRIVKGHRGTTFVFTRMPENKISS